MRSDFIHKIEQKQHASQSNIAMMLNPQIERLPLPITRIDDPFLPFGKEIIRATQDLVCAYMFDLAAYLAMGAAGAVALERTIRYVGNDTATILHGAFTGQDYSAACDITGFGVDALTLTNPADMPYYLSNPPYAGFVLREQGMELDTTPLEGGYYWQTENLLTLRNQQSDILTMRLTTDAVLYAGKQDDFAQEVRTAVQAML